jgi:hypothetical protein
LGRWNSPPDWQEILTYFRGSELQNYFTKILEDNLKAIIKPQYVDQIPKAVKGNVSKIMESKDERKIKDEIYDQLGSLTSPHWVFSLLPTLFDTSPPANQQQQTLTLCWIAPSRRFPVESCSASPLAWSACRMRTCSFSLPSLVFSACAFALFTFHCAFSLCLPLFSVIA